MADPSEQGLQRDAVSHVSTITTSVFHGREAEDSCTVVTRSEWYVGFDIIILVIQPRKEESKAGAGESDGLVVRVTHCSSKRLEFSSQNP